MTMGPLFARAGGVAPGAGPGFARRSAPRCHIENAVRDFLQRNPRESPHRQQRKNLPMKSEFDAAVHAIKARETTHGGR